MGRPAVGKEPFSIRISVEVEAVRPVAHVPMTLTYDASGLRLLSVVEGDFFGGPGRGAIMIDSSEAGRIVIGASRLGPDAGVQGTGRLLTLRFEALGSGRSEVRFDETRVLDASRSVIRAKTSNAVLDVVLELPSPPDAIKAPLEVRP